MKVFPNFWTDSILFFIISHCAGFHTDYPVDAPWLFKKEKCLIVDLCTKSSAVAISMIAISCVYVINWSHKLLLEKFAKKCLKSVATFHQGGCQMRPHLTQCTRQLGIAASSSETVHPLFHMAPVITWTSKPWKRSGEGFQVLRSRGF